MIFSCFSVFWYRVCPSPLSPQSFSVFMSITIYMKYRCNINIYMRDRCNKALSSYVTCSEHFTDGLHIRKSKLAGSHLTPKWLDWHREDCFSYACTTRKYYNLARFILHYSCYRHEWYFYEKNVKLWVIRQWKRSSHYVIAEAS